MVLYLHSIYKGGYAIDERVYGTDREIVGDFIQGAELSRNAAYLEAVEIAKQYGAKKLVIDL